MKRSQMRFDCAADTGSARECTASYGAAELNAAVLRHHYPATPEVPSDEVATINM
jgi:hypothetical protein